MTYIYDPNDAPTIHGLKISCLYDDQISQLESGTLISYARMDSRVDTILAKRMADDFYETASVFRYFSNKDQVQYIKETLNNYNNFLTNCSLELKRPTGNNYYYRSNYVFFEMLNDINKITEIQRSLNGKESTFNIAKVDFKWMFEKLPDLAYQTARTNLLKKDYWLSHDVYRDIIKNLPEDLLNELAPKILAYEKDVRWALLGNPYAKKEHKTEALKEIARRKSRISGFTVIITNDLLADLTPLARLNSIEVLFRSLSREQLIFKDITLQNFEELFFCTSMQRSDRVSKVVNDFKTYNNIKTENKNDDI